MATCENANKNICLSELQHLNREQRDTAYCLNLLGKGGGGVQNRPFFLFHPLKVQCHENLFLLRLWGFRLGPTDMAEPLLTAVNCPFNLLLSFKDNVHQSKMDFTIV